MHLSHMSRFVSKNGRKRGMKPHRRIEKCFTSALDFSLISFQSVSQSVNQLVGLIWKLKISPL